MASDKCLLSTVICAVTCFRVARWWCSESEEQLKQREQYLLSHEWQGSGCAPQAPPAHHLFPFLGKTTLGLLSPWAGPGALFLKLCYCLQTHHRQECSCSTMCKPTCSLPACPWGPPVPQGCSQTHSLPGHHGHIAITHRNAVLAAHRCVWSSCSAQTCFPSSLVCPKWIQAQLPFFTQFKVIQGLINWSTGCEPGCCTSSIHSVL